MKSEDRTHRAIRAVLLLAVTCASFASAQFARAQLPTTTVAKPTGTITGVNKAKLPPTATHGALVPKLELVSVANAGTIKIFNIRVTNLAEIPAELFKTEPNLPPNPCHETKPAPRLWLNIVDAHKGGTFGCKVVTSAQILKLFSFRTYKGEIPEIFVILTDLKTGTSYKSRALSTATK